jgi:TolA-binding protein
MRPARDPFDLISLGRRGELSAADEQRLRELLAASPELDALHEAGRAFDEAAPTQPGDDALIARIEERVISRTRAPRAASRRRFIVRACLVAALVTSSAVGAGVVLRPSAPNDAPAPSAAAVAQPSQPPPAASPAGTTRGTALAPDPSPPPSASVPPVPPAASSSVAQLPVTPMQSAPPPRVELAAPVTATSLFTAASRARMAGDRSEAIRLSRELITRFPSSGEAVTSHLSLGMLYLQDAQPSAALDEFRAYRKLTPTTAHAEPMWGESQALHQLGRTDEERALLQELLTRFPDSAYAAAARKRLASLP